MAEVRDSYLLTVGASETAGTVLTVTATSNFDASRKDTASVTVTDTPVEGTVPSITTSSLPNGKVGTAYNQTLAATSTATIT